MINKEELAQLGIDNEELQTKLSTHLEGKFSEISKSNQEEISKAVGKAYSNIESTLQEITGIEKPEGLKASDYAKLAIDKIKEQSNSKIKEFEEKLKTGVPDDVIKENQTLKDQISAFSETIKSKEDEWKGKLTEKENEYLTYKKDVSFKNAFPKFSEDANAYEVEHHVNEVKKLLNDNYELGWDEKGNFTATKDFNTKLVSEIIAENESIKKLIDVPRSQKGVGVNNKSDGNATELKLDGLSSEEKILAVRTHIKDVLKMDPLDINYAKIFGELIAKA